MLDLWVDARSSYSCGFLGFRSWFQVHGHFVGLSSGNFMKLAVVIEDQRATIRGYDHFQRTQNRYLSIGRLSIPRAQNSLRNLQRYFVYAIR